MDRLIESLASYPDGDLRIIPAAGIAYQADMRAERVGYDGEYFRKVCAYEDTAIARAVNRGRVALVQRHLPPGHILLDYGAGSGAFLRAAHAEGVPAHGFDVMPEAAAQLRMQQLFDDEPDHYAAVTLWDVLEHLEDPAAVLNRVAGMSWLFVSIPIFEDVRRVRESKHYRPGEHLYYFTARGFVAWMRCYGFHLLEESRHEVEAGRESIGAFAFRRLPEMNLERIAA